MISKFHGLTEIEYQCKDGKLIDCPDDKDSGPRLQPVTPSLASKGPGSKGSRAAMNPIRF
ncbi:hypothetical protein Hanom_Chr10g00963851 [Helianthus anomalus]